MHALHFSASDKAALYREVLPQIESVVADETDGFLFGRYVFERIGFGAVSRTFGMYTDSVRTRGVWSGLGEGRDDGR